MSEPESVSRRNVLRLGLLAVSATQVPLALPAPARAQGMKPGANLIGKLEGPEVITDPAQFPKSFKEAPMLAELVKAGKLPPVAGAHRRRTRWSSSRCARSASTAAPGGAASPAPSTPPTGTAPPRTTSCSTSTTPAPRSSRTSPAAGRSARTARSPRSCSARGHEVERRPAVHRRRLHVLVRGHVPEQGARARRRSP